MCLQVFCLGAQQGLPYLAAPVAAKAQRGENQELLPSMRRVQKDAVLVGSCCELV